MKKLSLYIHIPFCESKCPYCDFFSVKYNIDKVNEYVEYMCKQIEKYGKKYNRIVDTIYFGGGTPSVIGTDNIIKILTCIYTNFKVENAEITLEVNPTSAVRLDFKKLYENGVNRISVGMQSSNEEELALLGRNHDKNDVKNCVDIIKKGGIKNISLDVMVGISKQTKESLKTTLDFCNSLDVLHISAYILKIEEKTRYNKIKDKLNLPDEDNVADLYMYMVEHLKKYKYNQYEISNFCKEGYESKHNLKYWECEEYLGIGPASHSYVDEKRFYTPKKFKDFYDGIIIDDGVGGNEEEYIMLNLRLSKGVDFIKFEEKFGYSFPQKYIANASNPIFLDYVYISDKNIHIKEKGFLLSNYIISSILYND